MADVEVVRLQADEPDESNGITDVYIETLLEDHSVNATTAIVWRIKAGQAAKKVNTSTSQTRLETAARFDHAMQMYEMYAELAGGADALGDEGTGDWESVTMASAFPDDWGGEYAYWPGAGAQVPE
jgi:hypothetical protein